MINSPRNRGRHRGYCHSHFYPLEKTLKSLLAVNYSCSIENIVILHIGRFVCRNCLSYFRRDVSIYVFIVNLNLFNHVTHVSFLANTICTGLSVKFCLNNIKRCSWNGSQCTRNSTK